MKKMQKIQNNKIFKIIIFAVVLCIPLIYSFFYLKSYWDPYGNVKDMKIAIVNLDKGVNGTNQGNELVTELKDKDVIDISELSQEEAEKGLQNNEYYAVITIPTNFTECLESAKEEDKKVATITYSPNQQSNYLASQIINKVVTATEMELQSKVGKEVVSTLSDSLADVPDSLQKISDGADEIYNGTSSLKNGLGSLKDGIGELDTKYAEFNNGVESAYNGSKELNKGLEQVNSGINSLNTGASTLDETIGQISQGVQSISENSGEKINKLTGAIKKLDVGSKTLEQEVNDYTTDSNKLNTDIKAYVSDVQSIDDEQNAILKSIIEYNDTLNGSDTKVKELADKAKTVLDKQTQKDIVTTGTEISNSSVVLTKKSQKLKVVASTLSAGVEQLKTESAEISGLTENIEKLQGVLTSVKSGTEKLKTGVSNLKNGEAKIQVGSKSLENGLQTLNESSASVQTALDKLNEGSQSALTGSQDLLTGVAKFKKEIDTGLEESKTEISKLNGLNDFVSDPVEIKEEPYGKVDSYGIAFTPLFLSIGLWVGALMCYVVLYYDQRHRFGKLDHNEKNKILQNLLYIGIGLVDGILTGLILKLGLGFEVTNMAIYCLECGVVGAAFMTIIQFLIRNFGDIGKFLALIVLVLQLAAAGGTFPVETIDKGFRFLNPLLPMTYSISIFKECLINTSTNFIGKNTFILIALSVVPGIITLIVEIIKKNQGKNDNSIKE